MLGSDGKINFYCNDCGTKFVATTDQAGKSGECKNCGSPIAVPTPKGTQTKRTKTGNSPKKKYVWVMGTFLMDTEPNKIYRFVILAAFNLSTLGLCNWLMVLSKVIFPRERLLQIWITTFGYDKSLLLLVAGLSGIIRYGIPLFLWIKIFKWSKRKIKSVNLSFW